MSSQKVVLAVAATAALVASTEARWSANPPPTFPFEEETQKLKLGKIVKGVNTGLDLFGKAKSVGLFDEEEGNNYWELNGGASNGGNWNIGGKIGGTFDEEEEAQKLKLGKIVKGVHTGLDLFGKAKGVGLFDEEEYNWTGNPHVSIGLEEGLGGGWSSTGPFNPTPPFSPFEEETQKLKLGKIVKGVNTGLDLFGKAKSVGLFDEEEGNNYWEVGGGASNGGNWNINGKIGGTFDEEELQKLKLDLNKATKVITTANKMGLLEEDAELDEVQKLKLGKVIKGAVKVVKVAGAVGLLEEDEEFQKTNVLNALDKALDLYGKAKGVGLFEEEEGDWHLGAGVGNGGRWNVNGGIGNTFANGNGRWGVGANVGNGGSWGVNAGLSWRFDEDEEAPKRVKSHRKPLLQRKKLLTKQ